jgi:quercetin dioxygenase-like cupin family protein
MRWSPNCSAEFDTFANKSNIVSMKKLLFFLLIAFAGMQLQAQRDFVKAAKSLKPTEDFDNIHVQKLFTDARASVFAIWIKEKVRLHKHAAHSETVYILKGKGDMRIGRQMREVKKGDVIFIPEGTPHEVQVKGGTMKVLSIQAPEFRGKDRIFLDVKM